MIASDWECSLSSVSVQKNLELWVFIRYISHKCNCARNGLLSSAVHVSELWAKSQNYEELHVEYIHTFPVGIWWCSPCYTVLGIIRACPPVWQNR